MFNHVTCYLFSVRHSHLASSVSGWQVTLHLFSSQNLLSLIVPLILPAYLLANLCFIRSVWVTNLYSVQEHYPCVCSLYCYWYFLFASFSGLLRIKSKAVYMITCALILNELHIQPLFFWDRASLCRSSWSGTYCDDPIPLTLASWILELLPVYWY